MTQLPHDKTRPSLVSKNVIQCLREKKSKEKKKRYKEPKIIKNKKLNVKKSNQKH